MFETVILAVCSYHVTCAFQRESIFYGCMNVKELLARNRRDIWSLNDWNGTPTRNHLVCELTLNHFAEKVKWFRSVGSSYLCGDSDCTFLSYHIRVSEWICILCFCAPRACFGARSSLTFKQPESVDSLWNGYVTRNSDKKAWACMRYYKARTWKSNNRAHL